MVLIHQIVNVLINPVFLVLVLLVAGLISRWRGRTRLGGVLLGGGVSVLFLMSWPPLVDAVGIWFEHDYPAAYAEEYPAVDAIIVLGGGVGMPPPDIDCPYPDMSEAADRVWHGARLWRAQQKLKSESSVKVYCTGPDVSRSTPPLLKDLGVPEDAIVALNDPLNTEEEARRYERELHGKTVLLVTSALHMKRATLIFRKYAPGVSVIPAATDHQFIDVSSRFYRWHYYFPRLDALGRASAIEHELIGILRYIW